MDTEAFIRDCAKKQWSKKATYDTLGVTAAKFADMCELIPGLVWPPQNASLHRQQYYERRKGTLTGAGRVALLAASEKARIKRLLWVEICGMCMPARDVYETYKDFIQISYSSVRRRLHKGMSVYDSFFGNPQSTIGHHKSHWHTTSFKVDRHEQMRAASALLQERTDPVSCLCVAGGTGQSKK